MWAPCSPCGGGVCGGVPQGAHWLAVAVALARESDSDRWTLRLS